MKSGNSFLQALYANRGDQRGITGLETAIVLIAFVVVSSVFAFAALSTGMFSSDKARETVEAGLAKTRSTIELKGAVIGVSLTTGATGVLTSIEFHVSQSAGGATVDLTPGAVVIRYTDERQTKLFASTAGMEVIGVGTADADTLLERNETYKIKLINLETTGSGEDKLDSTIGVKQTFLLEVIPTAGAILHIERTTPINMSLVNLLN